MATPLVIVITLWITGFLSVLNMACAIYFRKRRAVEIVSYVAAGLVELGIFVFALLLHFGVLKHIPYHLPPGLPINRAEIGAALAIGVGLLPVTYWHRSSSTRIRAMMAKEAEEMRNRDAAVRVRSAAPGEWMN
ncbi:MAG TPA: hypothetical protein VGT44_02320 [Ktedonobacteraceae bacterium]|nr:hypothetical protein [Ktedonobacteraceae bacterium]